MTVILHPETERAFDKWRIQLPQSSLLYGPKGVGLFTAAKAVAEQFGLPLTVSPMTTKTSQIAQISVERIRQLYEQTRTKEAQGIKRVVIIDDGELMSPAAQNALLKLLEEPGQSTSFIVTSHRPERLLPTIKSRLQPLYVQPIDRSQTMQFLASLKPTFSVDQNQLLFVADGLPAELTRLTADETEYEKTVARMRLAKNLLQSPAFERLSLVTSTKPTRPEALRLIEALVQLRRTKSNETMPADIDKLLVAYDRINGGGNIQVQLVSALI